MYLGPDLSVKKLWGLRRSSMRKDNQHILSYSVFCKIVQDQFNIGFGNSKSDVCYRCEKVTNIIKQPIHLLKTLLLCESIVYTNCVQKHFMSSKIGLRTCLEASIRHATKSAPVYD